MKVNIAEFQKKYIKGALIPVDIMQQFTECFLRGEEYADVRDTVFEEMKIRQFYNEHPELEPKTDWQMLILCRKVIDLLKRYINKESIEDWELADLQKTLAIEIDRRKVKNEPCEEISSLYEDIMWLKCDIIPNNE